MGMQLPNLAQPFWPRICLICCRRSCAACSNLANHEYLASADQPPLARHCREHSDLRIDRPRRARTSAAIDRHRLGLGHDCPALSGVAHVPAVWTAQTAAQGLAALIGETQCRTLGAGPHPEFRTAAVFTGT